MNTSHTTVVMSIEDAQDLHAKHCRPYNPQFGQPISSPQFTSLPDDSGDNLMQQMHSISYGSSGLISDPIIHALAINAPVYCGLGIRVRSSGVAKLEITEHLRFEGVITDPLYVLDTSKDCTSLIIGTFVVTPRGLHAHTPAEVKADPSLWGMSIDHDWTTHTAETVLFLTSTEAWNKAIPFPIENVQRALETYLQSLDTEITSYQDPRHLPSILINGSMQRLLSLDLISDGQRLQGLTSLDISGRRAQARDLRA